MTRPPLTEADARAGVLPAPMTRLQWDALHEASARETTQRVEQICARVVAARITDLKAELRSRAIP